MKNKITIYDIVIVALMAAMVFATTYFIKIEIPTPAGITMLKAGNIVCLLAALLFGSVRGGLAAGIGSMFFDLLNPMYVASAPFTLVFFFIMAFVCGKIAHMNNYKGEKTIINILAAAIGAISYIILHISKTIITLMLAGSSFIPAFATSVPKIMTSSANALIAVTFSVLLVPILRKALLKSGIYDKIIN